MYNLLFINLIVVHLFLLISLVSIYSSWNNFLLMMLSIELSMVSIILLFIIFSFQMTDIITQIYALLILTVATSETVIGLSLLINFINLKHDIQITTI